METYSVWLKPVSGDLEKLIDELTYEQAATYVEGFWKWRSFRGWKVSESDPGALSIVRNSNGESMACKALFETVLLIMQNNEVTEERIVYSRGSREQAIAFKKGMQDALSFNPEYLSLDPKLDDWQDPSGRILRLLVRPFQENYLIAYYMEDGYGPDGPIQPLRNLSRTEASDILNFFRRILKIQTKAIRTAPDVLRGLCKLLILDGEVAIQTKAVYPEEDDVCRS